MSDLVRLGALWKGKDKDGQPILSGTINPHTRVLILKNGFKREEKQPDYFLYLAANEKKEPGESQAAEDEETPF